MQATQEKTWMSMVGGILNIVAGASGALMAVTFIFLLVFTVSWTIPYDYVRPYDMPFPTPFLTVILVVGLVVCILGVTFSIMGGVFAMQRRRWGWALAGAIVAIFLSLPFGVLATIFIALGKDEFHNA